MLTLGIRQSLRFSFGPDAAEYNRPRAEHWWFPTLLVVLLSAGCGRPPTVTDAELLSRAKGAVKRGDQQSARGDLDQLLERQPLHAEALIYRAQLARESDDDSAALAFVRRVPGDSPTLAGTAKYLEGSILLAGGRAKPGEECLRQSIALHPTYRPPRVALIELLLTQMRGREAREELLSLRVLQPWSLVQLVQFQSSSTELARPPDSRKILEGYVGNDPEDRVSLIALVRDDLAANDASAAVRRLKPVVARWPDDDRFQGLLTESLVRAERLPEAKSSRGSQFPAAGVSVWGWRGAAHLAEAESEWSKAAAAWWQVVMASPDDRTANYRLAVALERAGHREAAQAQYERTRRVELLLDHVSHILAGDTQRTGLVAGMAFKTAELLVELQRPNDARLWLEFVARLTPGDPAIAALWKRAGGVEASGDSLAIERVRYGEGLLIAAAKSAAPRAKQRPTEDVAALTASTIRLADRHAEAGLSFQHFNGPTEFKYLLESLGGGVAALDYDGDGRPDLYFPQGCRIPYVASDEEHLDRLFRNLGDGRFVETTSMAGIRENRYSQGIAAGDFDNDGFPDLVVGNYGINTFWKNQGDGTYLEISERLGGGAEHWTSSLAWSDLDRDGDLDLYVANYVLDAKKVCRTPEGTVAACSPGNFEGEPDQLFLNEGDGTFREASLVACGLDALEGKGLGVVVADLDDDGWPDVYVANDGTPNFLFRNTGRNGANSPVFASDGFSSGLAVSGDGRSQAGMGIACADFNGDLRLDLYVTNFFNDYNTLYLNAGGGLFEDQTARAGLVAPTMQRLGFGTQAIDFDLDGWPDLLVANGHIDDFRASGVPWKMSAQVFRNRHGKSWEDCSETAGTYFENEVLGRAIARLDWNRDGLPDAVIVHQDGPAALLANTSKARGRSLTVRLVGTACNRDAIGARVRVTSGGRTQTQTLCGGDGYFATNEHRLFFGVGDEQSGQIDLLQIDWPDGASENHHGLNASGEWTFVQSARQSRWFRGTEPRELKFQGGNGD